MSDVLDRLKSALAGRYSIERELGRGGMATVYLARDLKHDRQVAVKVLHPELAAVVGAERFLNEIQVTARLSHPHILPLHDSGEAESFLYYVMPYVAGESLRQRLERETQLPVDDALRITGQVASALEYAHRHEVIHRDIKPENVLLHEGEAMVADFGIALAVSAAGGERLTETGLSLGTPEYMSPEQALGEGELDARSDIYSLACVLYEMLVGEPPHTGPTAMAVLAKRLSDPVPSARRLRAAIPVPVDAALLRALTKERVDRFGSAREFAEALAAEVGEDVEAVKSIVVLPFENLSPDPDDAFFADGLTDELIADLSKVRAVRVISRTSAVAFRGTAQTVPAIARQLNVRYALEGSVRRAGNSLRITAQLIDAVSDQHLWAEKYSGTVDDVFGMQEKVSRAIVDALKVQLTPDEHRRIAERRIDNVAAYECYLRAKAKALELSEDGASRALQHLQDGLRIIGDNSLLYSGMAFAYFQLVNIGVQQEEYLAKAHQCVDKALALDPMCADAYAVLGWIGHLEGDFAHSVRESKKALAINPDHTFALASLAVAYILVGRPAAAAPVCEKLMQLDPLDFLTQWAQGGLAFYNGQFDRAVSLWRAFSEQYPSVVYAPFAYAVALIYSGESDASVPIIDGNAAAHPDNAVAKVGLVLKYGIRRDKSAAYTQMTPDLIKTAERDCTYAHHLAGAFAMLGEKAEALKWLEAAVNAGFINYPMLAEHDPLLESIRGQQRFKKLMERVKEESEEFEV